jgi:hypothetical protein
MRETRKDGNRLPSPAGAGMTSVGRKHQDIGTGRYMAGVGSSAFPAASRPVAAAAHKMELAAALELARHRPSPGLAEMRPSRVSQDAIVRR